MKAGASALSPRLDPLRDPLATNQDEEELSMDPEVPQEGSPHQFGPPWSGLGDVFRKLHEQDEARPSDSQARLRPDDFVMLLRWELRSPDWLASRVN